MGAALVVDALSRLADLTADPQPEAGVTYATKIDKSEARIDWSETAEEVDRKIRGLSPFPGAWCEFHGDRLKLLSSRLSVGNGAAGEVLDDTLTIACGTGAIEVLTLQRAGKGAQQRDVFLRGMDIPKGSVLR
jgi:methionyl-tRNA formyltransferase